MLLLVFLFCEEQIEEFINWGFKKEYWIFSNSPIARKQVLLFFCQFCNKYCWSCHVFAVHFCRKIRRCRHRRFSMVYIEKLNICSLFAGLPYFPAKVNGKNVTLHNRSNSIYVHENSTSPGYMKEKNMDILIDFSACSFTKTSILTLLNDLLTNME